MELWPSNGGQDSQKRAELVSFEGWYEGVGGKREGKGNNKGERSTTQRCTTTIIYSCVGRTGEGNKLELFNKKLSRERRTLVQSLGQKKYIWRYF
ncbi:hypothetical protein I7I50_06024 [Histoplasma capsulatum G186AR]|uniref:Uncharacterized protein n=1 Tax=Ajellomyces capsulatus TaxID=5037 RepID=A0A8H8D1Y4_AJECA|nr:hypothetical protein I7I52_08762 [Histoplasma capsulatum]QSS67054.1 hypothetical protein I7I50_06024 [Histoplasma capsulatum G186AR]